MRFDAGSSDRSLFEVRTFDVCVIGTGPAGASLARSLAAQGLDVALMEGGDLEWTPESQDVYVGENLGLDYLDLDAARLRMFGGTSGHWNGQCRELDPGNFAARPHHPLGAWPIAKADLDPYQPAADAILDVSDPALPDIPVPGEAFRRVQYRFSPPTRFAEKYEAEFTAAPRIFLCLNASLIDLRLDETLETVTGAVFRSYAPGDPGFTVRARAYALCCGGIENARLLLNFDSQVPGGIGNRHDLVGRHFAEHLSFHLGEMIYQKPPDADFLFFTPSEAFMAENETLSLVLRFNHQPPPRTTLGREVTRSLQCAAPFGDRLAAAVNGRAMSCDRGGVSDFLALSGAEHGLWARVVTNCEQEMNPDSRVLLMAARDGFGMRRVALDWRLTEMDYRTMQRSTLALARHVAEHGLGRMRVYDWLLAKDPVAPTPRDGNGHAGSWHHMGTTRMADDPRRGVVDRNCRVHGTRNLHVGGSSVFSSVGYANPTYTVTQLALRLGDHLGRELQS